MTGRPGRSRMAGLPGGRYDRAAAARVLAEVAGPGAFGQVGLGGPRRLEPEVVPLDGQLTAPQLEYVNSRMRPCPPALVVSAASKVSWRDSGGGADVAHCGPLRPIVPGGAPGGAPAMWRAVLGAGGGGGGGGGGAGGGGGGAGQ